MSPNKLSRGAVLLAAAICCCPTSSWADAAEEVNKQISKLIGDAISSRVGSAIAPAAAPSATERNNIWASYTRLEVDFSAPGAANFDSRTHLGIGGYDRDLSDKLVLGLALSKSDSSPTGKTWGVTPYAAYRFTNSVFGVLRLDYQRSEADITTAAIPAFPPFFAGTPASTNSVKSDLYGAAVSLNAVARTGNLRMKGRLEVGASESDSNQGGDFSSTNYVADGEVGYYFTPGFNVFGGLQLSQSNRSDSYSASARVGLEKEFGRGSAVFAKFEKQFDDDLPSGTNVDVKSFTVGLRIRF